MAGHGENMLDRILEALNLPMLTRCYELPALFEQCSLRELQEIFPFLVHSMFGVGSDGLGWGLRSTTIENSPQLFNTLCEFFAPTGPMFRLCYRLLNDSIKFNFSLDLLPQKTMMMLQSGHYAAFYADLVNVDPFQRCIYSLSLNAFDFYMAHFVIHATLPLHLLFPAPLQVHNNRMRTVYFCLTASYLATFLPINLDEVVTPNDLCLSIKSPQALPAPTLQTRPKLKYLRIPELMYASGDGSGTQQTILNAADSHSCNWRTESVLYIYIDFWLRYDVAEARDLPSSEFIRVVRLLIKQVHAFGNAALLDQSGMAVLRKLAQPLMRAHMYSFIKSIVDRWPLDISMSIVVELWLSYIQPWRYSRFDGLSKKFIDTDMGYSDMRYDRFIIDNLPTYTQIFALFLPRFVRLDFKSYPNVMMLLRLSQVFSQPELSEKLCRAEQSYSGMINTRDHHINEQRMYSLYNSGNSLINNDEVTTSFAPEPYKPMFGPEMHNELGGFIRVVLIARLQVLQEINTMRKVIAKQRNAFGFFRRLFANIFEEISPAQTKLQEITQIPAYLESVARSFATAFNLSFPEQCLEVSAEQLDLLQFGLDDNSEFNNVSPLNNMPIPRTVPDLNRSLDPALFPIEDYECKVLVRQLHKISTKINQLLGKKMCDSWERTDLFGKLTRLILLPPMTTQSFEKFTGNHVQLCEEELPPRLCLRPLASYRFLIFFAILVCLSHLIWNIPGVNFVLFTWLGIISLFVLCLFK